MAAAAVEWVLRLTDRVSGPAQGIERRLGLVERMLRRVDATARRVSGGGFGGFGRAAEVAAKRGGQAWKGMNDQIGQTREQLGGLTGQIQGLMAVAVGLTGVGMLGKSVVDGAAYKQSQLTILKGMMKGDADLAAALFERAQKFAAATPFTTREILDATRQSVAIGFSDTQALPVVELAAKLSSGSGKGLDQVMEAFAALRGGDFGQAFGIGQGFSNLNINREMLKKAGLRFDAQGSYKGTVTQGLRAVEKIINSQFGNALDEQSKGLSGLASTLASRPEELAMSLVDSRGNSRALAPLQRFMSNLADLTDLEKGPGKKIQDRFENSAIKLTQALFVPLADATGGQKGEEWINRLLDRVDQFSAWTEKNGPGIVANLRGFGEGLKFVADGVNFLLTPITKLMSLLDRMNNGSGEGMTGKLLGMLAGGALALRLGNILTMGMGGKLLQSGGSRLWEKVMNKVTGRPLTERLPGGLFKDEDGKWHHRGGKYASQESVAQARARAAARAGWMGKLRGGAGRLLARLTPLMARLVPWIARAATLFAGLSNPIGWAVAGVTALVAGGALLYRKFKPFRKLVDNVYAGIKSWGKGITEGVQAAWNRLPAPLREGLEAVVRFSPAGMAAGASSWALDRFGGAPEATPIATPVASNPRATPVTLPYTGIGTGVAGPVNITNTFNVAGSMDGQAVTDINDSFSTLALEGGAS